MECPLCGCDDLREAASRVVLFRGEVCHASCVDYFEQGCNVEFEHDSMDGDFDSAMRDAGHGTDEDYGYFGDYE
jgi:hypothetical protein